MRWKGYFSNDIYKNGLWKNFEFTKCFIKKILFHSPVPSLPTHPKYSTMISSILQPLTPHYPIQTSQYTPLAHSKHPTQNLQHSPLTQPNHSTYTFQHTTRTETTFQDDTSVDDLLRCETSREIGSQGGQGRGREGGIVGSSDGGRVRDTHRRKNRSRKGDGEGSRQGDRERGRQGDREGTPAILLLNNFPNVVVYSDSWLQR